MTEDTRVKSPVIEELFKPLVVILCPRTFHWSKQSHGLKVKLENIVYFLKWEQLQSHTAKGRDSKEGELRSLMRCITVGEQGDWPDFGNTHLSCSHFCISLVYTY